MRIDLGVRRRLRPSRNTTRPIHLSPLSGIARLQGGSVLAAVHGCGRHAWRLYRRTRDWSPPGHRRLAGLLCLAVLLLPLLACSRAAGGAGAVGASRGASSGPTAVSSPAAGFPVTITDDQGRPVRLERRPQRIVSAAPSNTEILFALGAGDRVVGVTQFCDYPEEAKSRPKIGDLKPNLEAIIALQPDLVMGISGMPTEVLAGLESAKVPVIIWSPQQFDGVLRNIELTGRAVGAEAAATRIVQDMRTRWDAVAAKARTATRRPRTLYELDATDPTKPYAAGAGNFVDAMITAAGGVNVAASTGQTWPQLSLEAVVSLDPEVVVLGDSAFGVTAESVARRPGWRQLTAVQRGALVPVPDSNLTTRPGPRLVQGLELIARGLHPELFGTGS